MSPRGTAFMTVKRDRLDGIVPWTANWFAGADVHGSYYGAPLRLADDARRLDTSPAWHNWVGTAATLAVVEELGIDRIHAHDLALANRFRAGLGLPESDNPIVVAEAERAPLLERAGIVAAVRAGRLRASWHAYNSEEDVDRVLDVLAG
jgi:selenocysteine lyase/cysteine desulfurase